MPTGIKKRPLGAWPDNEKHKETAPLEEAGSESESGHQPDPEAIEEETVLERAKKMGLYKQSTEESQEEVNLAEEEEEDIEEE